MCGTHRVLPGPAARRMEDYGIMTTHHSRGFTLIELLTVIAIIAILAGITAGTLPGVIERARITDVKSDWNAIQKGLTAYYTEHNTYPPGYGFRTWLSREHQPGITRDFQFVDPGPYRGEIEWNDKSSPDMYNFVPYTVAIDIQGSADLYDFYSPGADTDQNGYISAMEFFPANGSLNMFMPWAGRNIQDTEELPETPFIYAPVNLEVFRRLVGAIQVNSQRVANVDEGRKITPDTNVFIYGGQKYWTGLSWPDTNLSGNQYMGKYVRDVVAPRYDAYVLISAGPQQSTAGLACPGYSLLGQDPQAMENNFLNSISPLYIRESPYQALALRTYYLATRDANQNGEPDFSYEARRAGESKTLDASESADEIQLYSLPDGSRGYGPLIFHQEG